MVKVSKQMLAFKSIDDKLQPSKPALDLLVKVVEDFVLELGRRCHRTVIKENRLRVTAKDVKEVLTQI